MTNEITLPESTCIISSEIARKPGPTVTQQAKHDNSTEPTDEEYDDFDEDNSLDHDNDGDRSGDSRNKNQTGLKQQSKWEEMFARLVAFKEQYGDCLVPNRYQEDPQLGSWVSTQRRHYKILMSGSGESTPMTPARASKLESIGFKWSTKDPRHVPWELRYRELVDFQRKYGHSQVPIGWTENVQLSNWVSTQRQEYKLKQKGRQSRLSNDRIKLLENLDFIWEAQRGGPRRKQRATVKVPEKSNPVDLKTQRVKSGHRKRGALSGNIGVSRPKQVLSQHVLSGPFIQPGRLIAVPVPVAASHITGTTTATFPTGILAGNVHVAASPWQLLPTGAFQHSLPAMAVHSVFPIAQWPVAATPMPVGMVPVWANVAPGHAPHAFFLQPPNLAMASSQSMNIKLHQGPAKGASRKNQVKPRKD